MKVIVISVSGPPSVLYPPFSKAISEIIGCQSSDLDYYPIPKNPDLTVVVDSPGSHPLGGCSIPPPRGCSGGVY